MIKLLNIKHAYGLLTFSIPVIYSRRNVYILSGKPKFIALAYMNEKFFFFAYSLFLTSITVAVFPIPGTPEMSMININIT